MSSIEKIIASKLKDMNKSISIAESCTGGAICSKIVHNKGASIIFKGGIICYSTESKMKLLDLDSKIIRREYILEGQRSCFDINMDGLGPT